MPMFGDLNKLNSQPENKQPAIKPAASSPTPPVPPATAPVPLRPSPAVPEIGDVSSTHKRLNVRTNDRTFERTRVRHSFDIFTDQLLSLREIALRRQMVFGKKTLLGDLVQEALDLFISKERNKE